MKKIIFGFTIITALLMHENSAAASMKETAGSLLAKVKTTDGINKKEANSIAKAYFLIHVGCGSFQDVTELKDAWVVNGVHGFAAEPITGFLINKRTGAITSPIGPSYERPKDLL
jgi:hypothetical protein